jgi:hypothetical protein
VFFIFGYRQVVIEKMRVLIATCGTMGSSHACAYQKIDGFEIAGVISRTSASREKLNQQSEAESWSGQRP